MGRTSDEEGESSTKVCKSDEIDDRPLKKARYVWQIKGKYHLKKNEEKDPCFPTKSSNKDDVVPCKHTLCNNDSLCDDNLNNMDVTEGNNLYLNLNPSDKNENKPERRNLLLNDAECEDDIKDIKTESESSSSSPTDWSVTSNARLPARPTSTWQLRKWQARQVARCFVDNTINRVLEDMGFVPLPVDADDILDDFPMTESENDESLEDEAVLMAIHRHGLRTEEEPATPASDRKDKTEVVKSETTQSKVCGDLQNSANTPCACTIPSNQETNTFGNLDPFHHRPVYWDQTQLDPHKLFHLPLDSSELMHRLFSDGLFNSVINSDSSSDSDVTSHDEIMVTERSSEKGTTPEEDEDDDEDDDDDDDDEGNENEDEVKDHFTTKQKSKEASSQEQDNNMPSFEHNDFLDKAVAVAIQKKGLSKFSCADFG